ncbi:MAG: hypothetical protein IPF57_25450 [Gammaproteobacteria bacterium]|nr:hypothetical protein [Gammaproteobacteria bacterium]
MIMITGDPAHRGAHRGRSGVITSDASAAGRSSTRIDPGTLGRAQVPFVAVALTTSVSPVAPARTSSVSVLAAATGQVAAMTGDGAQ